MHKTLKCSEKWKFEHLQWHDNLSAFIRHQCPHFHSAEQCKYLHSTMLKTFPGIGCKAVSEDAAACLCSLAKTERSWSVIHHSGSPAGPADVQGNTKWQLHCKCDKWTHGRPLGSSLQICGTLMQHVCVYECLKEAKRCRGKEKYKDFPHCMHGNVPKCCWASLQLFHQMDVTSLAVLSSCTVQCILWDSAQQPDGATYFKSEVVQIYILYVWHCSKKKIIIIFFSNDTTLKFVPFLGK